MTTIPVNNLDWALDQLISGELKTRDLIWLIPSENSISPLAHLALSSHSVNRYLFKYPMDDHILHLGTENYHKLYEFCIESLKRLLNAKYVSLAPLSGLSTMVMVIACCSSPGMKIYCIPTNRGGHTHTQAVVEMMGRYLEYIPYKSVNGWYDIDYKRLKNKLKNSEAGLVYIDPMVCQYNFDYEKIRDVIPSSFYLHYDGSHVMGLIAGNSCHNPLDYGFDSFGGSLHKTFPGIQKGIFVSNNKTDYDHFEKYGAKLVSSLNLSSIMSLSIILSETVDFFHSYAQQVRNNCQYLATKLKELGVALHGYDDRLPDSHVLLIKQRSIKDAILGSQLLCESGIITHPTMMPIQGRVGGIRLGVQEATVLGMKENEMNIIAHIIHKVLLLRQPPKQFREETHMLALNYRWPTYSTIDSNQLRKLYSSIIE